MNQELGIKNSQTTISIIIPVYNHAHTLERCLFSIYKQTYRPIEIIIVNDGSKDNFLEVTEKLSAADWTADLQINILEQENKGASAARNQGVAKATGEYIIFWDADTVGEPNMLEKMVAILEKNPDASYVYSQFLFGWKKIKSRTFDADTLKKNNFIDTTSFFGRHVLLLLTKEGRRGGPFDESLKRFQDWDLWLALLEKNKTGVFVPEVLFKKIVEGRKGISNWLPSFVYKLPWKIRAVREYEAARQVVLQKHRTLRESATTK